LFTAINSNLVLLSSNSNKNLLGRPPPCNPLIWTEPDLPAIGSNPHSHYEPAAGAAAAANHNVSLLFLLLLLQLWLLLVDDAFAASLRGNASPQQPPAYIM
jgi:hypothetical protein